MTHKLMQMILSNRAPEGSLRIEASGKEVTVYLYDAIGWLGVEAKPFVEALAGVQADTIHLRINSPGGDVFEARAIKTALEQHPARVVAHIDGLAASAATFVMLAADEIRASDGAFVMIHNPWGLTMGTANDMRSQAELLDKVAGVIVNDYAKKTGMDQDRLHQMMDDETWMTAQEAKDFGFIDEVVATRTTKNTFNLSAYQKTPSALLEPERAHFDALLQERQRAEARLTLYEKGAA